MVENPVSSGTCKAILSVTIVGWNVVPTLQGAKGAARVREAKVKAARAVVGGQRVAWQQTLMHNDRAILALRRHQNTPGIRNVQLSPLRNSLQNSARPKPCARPFHLQAHSGRRKAESQSMQKKRMSRWIMNLR